MTAKAESVSNGEHKQELEAAFKAAKKSLDDSISDAQAVADQFSDDAKKEVRKAADHSRQFVRNNPGVAILGAVGLGVIVGMALRSGR